MRRCPSLCFLAALLVALVSSAKVAVKRKKIALITASLPWVFGPYQAQMHELSLILDSSPSGIEYDIYWVTTTPLPKGVYKTWDDVPKTTVVRPPDGFKLGHLTFVGNDWTAGGGSGDLLSSSRINALGREHGFDHIMTLMDITKMVPDEPFAQPVTAWIPLHSETVRRSSVDYWVLRSYHGIAALSPSGARAIDDAVGSHVDLLDDGSGEPSAMGKMRGAAHVDFVPHVIDRKKIAKDAQEGLSLLEKASAAEADALLSGSRRYPVVDNIREPTLRPETDESLFARDGKRKDDFIVLLQGGNYDSEDRKGWDTSIQAYVRFYNSLTLEEREKTHLLIHSFESYLISSDRNNNMDAPANVVPIGLSINLALRDAGMPEGSYTLDIAKHHVNVVAAYKVSERFSFARRGLLFFLSNEHKIIKYTETRVRLPPPEQGRGLRHERPRVPGGRNARHNDQLHRHGRLHQGRHRRPAPPDGAHSQRDLRPGPSRRAGDRRRDTRNAR